MATLSLFFAINKVLQTPFLVFDEADAFLDQNNTKKYLDIMKKVILIFLFFKVCEWRKNVMYCNYSQKRDFWKLLVISWNYI